MTFRRITNLALAVCLLAIPAFARDYKLGDLQISQPSTRATAPTAPSAGGFLTITNKGAAPDKLIAVKSPAAEMTQIHEMKMEGDIMRMREREGGLEIAAGADEAQIEACRLELEARLRALEDRAHALL